jgi:hypothetical protein
MQGALPLPAAAGPQELDGTGRALGSITCCDALPLSPANIPKHGAATPRRRPPTGSIVQPRRLGCGRAQRGAPGRAAPAPAGRGACTPGSLKSAAAAGGAGAPSQGQTCACPSGQGATSASPAAVPNAQQTTCGRPAGSSAARPPELEGRPPRRRHGAEPANECPACCAAARRRLTRRAELARLQGLGVLRGRGHGWARPNVEKGVCFGAQNSIIASTRARSGGCVVEVLNTHTARRHAASRGRLVVGLGEGPSPPPAGGGPGCHGAGRAVAAGGCGLLS